MFDSRNLFYKIKWNFGKNRTFTETLISFSLFWEITCSKLISFIKLFTKKWYYNLEELEKNEKK